MEKKTFMQKLKNMGPAAIITSAFIGPGTITTATLVGVKFQYALLWAVVFSGIALIVLMEMSSRIAIASHKNVIDAAIALKPESRGWRLFVQIFVGLAVGISCFAFQSGNEIGASGTPCILIPSPNVTNNHQEKNAMILQGRGAAVVVPEAGCSGKLLFDTAREILADTERTKSMRQAASSLAVVDSAQRIYETALELIQSR